MTEDGEMSVVVPVRLAPETAVSTLRALLARQGLEVIAVVSTEDPSALLLHQLKAQSPGLEVVEVPGACSVPQLRARGIRRARGRLVAITEDHCSFSESWPAATRPLTRQPKGWRGRRPGDQRPPRRSRRVGDLFLPLRRGHATRLARRGELSLRMQRLLSPRAA